MPQSVTIVGSGNIAYHLVKAFLDTSIIVQKVISRSYNPAIHGGKAIWSNHFQGIESDVILVCVSDDAIREVAAKIPVSDQQIVAHVSGSKDITVLKEPGHMHYGSFYPLQTFSADRDVDWSEIPIGIEGSTDKTESRLLELASHLSNRPLKMNSAQRVLLHLAAVFANNFTNHMIHEATKIMDEARIDPHLLDALIYETVRKSLDLGAQKAQTGPAIRGDEETMKHHLGIMPNSNSQELYRLISQQIQHFGRLNE